MSEVKSNVRMATPEDQADIMKMCRELHSENGLFPMDDAKVAEKLKLAFLRKFGMIGVIGLPGKVEAIMFLVLSQPWYAADHWYLEELFSFVRPQFRKSTHAKALVEWAKRAADTLQVPAVIAVLSNKRTEAKVRLYRRQLGNPAGAFFLYVPPEVSVMNRETANPESFHLKWRGAA